MHSATYIRRKKGHTRSGTTLEIVGPEILDGMYYMVVVSDLKNPKTNQKSAGFTPEEREGMTQLLSEGFVDTFRHFNPETEGAYTFWTYMSNARAKNTGW